MCRSKLVSGTKAHVVVRQIPTDSHPAQLMWLGWKWHSPKIFRNIIKVQWPTVHPTSFCILKKTFLVAMFSFLKWSFTDTEEWRQILQDSAPARSPPFVSWSSFEIFETLVTYTLCYWSKLLTLNNRHVILSFSVLSKILPFYVQRCFLNLDVRYLPILRFYRAPIIICERCSEDFSGGDVGGRRPWRWETNKQILNFVHFHF